MIAGIARNDYRGEVPDLTDRKALIAVPLGTKVLIHPNDGIIRVADVGRFRAARR
jgi:hypothetical protein